MQQVDVLPFLKSLEYERPCNWCRKTIVNGPYLCDPCAAKAEAMREDGGFSTALESIPLKFRWATFERPELTSRVKGGSDSVRRAREAVEDGHSITLIAPPGAGKTSLACACLRLVIDSGKDKVPMRAKVRAAGCRFFDAYAIAKSRSQYGLGRGEAPEMDAALRASCLVLDELGGERHDAGPVAELLHERHAGNRQTIVTTPWSQERIAERYGDGIARRLWEGAVLNLGGSR